MPSKLGVHIQHVVDMAGQLAWIERTQPAVAKLMADEPPFVLEGRLRSPETFWVGRVWTDDDDMRRPHRRAEEMRDRILRKAMCRAVDAWEGFNEITGGHGWNDETRRYLECELWLCEFLHAEDLSYVAGSWSVGCPSDLGVWKWHYMLELMGMADYLGLHEYCAPSMWEPRAFDPRYTDREAYLTSGWYTLRYRKVREMLTAYLEHEPPPIIITECGIDSGARKWWVDGQGGWKAFASVPEAIEQFAWYDRQLRMDDYVVGATIFQVGTADQYNWGTFDWYHSPEAREALAVYIESQATSEPPPAGDWENRALVAEDKLEQIHEISA